MYHINTEKELLFVYPSMEKETQETCVSALFDVSDRKSKRAPLCVLYQIGKGKELFFVYPSMKKKRQETCVSALSDA